MVGDSRGMHWATSVPLGVARLTAELVHSDPVTKRDRRGAARSRSPRSSARCRAAVAALRAADGRRQQRHARGARAHGRAVRRDEDVPCHAEPAHDHTRRVPRRAQGDHRVDRGRAPPLRRARRPSGRPRRRRLDVPRHRDGRSSTSTRSPSPSGRLREGIVLDAVRPPRPRRLVRRPTRHPARVGHRPRPALQLGRGATPAPSPASRSSCSTPPRSSTSLDAADRELLELAALAARHRRARVEHRPPPPRRLPRSQRPAARLRARRGRAARRDRALAPPRRAPRLRRVPAPRRRRDRARPRPRRDPARRRRPRPQPGGHRRRGST